MIELVRLIKCKKTGKIHCPICLKETSDNGSCLECKKCSKYFPYFEEEKINFDWVEEQRREINAKVSFFNSCGFFKKLLFAVIHGSNFVPTNNEKNIYRLYQRKEKEDVGN